jgi:hypothetical protein
VPQALASQLQAPSLVRRRGVSGAIRNCCISAEQDGTLEAVLSDSAVLQRLLQPLSGEEPKEVDDTVREALAESVQVGGARGGGGGGGGGVGGQGLGCRGCRGCSEACSMACNAE